MAALKRGLGSSAAVIRNDSYLVVDTHVLEQLHGGAVVYVVGAGAADGNLARVCVYIVNNVLRGLPAGVRAGGEQVVVGNNVADVLEVLVQRLSGLTAHGVGDEVHLVVGHDGVAVVLAVVALKCADVAGRALNVYRNGGSAEIEVLHHAANEVVGAAARSVGDNDLNVVLLR